MEIVILLEKTILIEKVILFEILILLEIVFLIARDSVSNSYSNFAMLSNFDEMRKMIIAARP